MVVECTGTERGLGMALEAVWPRGTVVLKSTVAGAPTLHLAPIVIHEIRVIGSRCRPFAPALRALATGAVAVDGMVHDRFALRDGVRAFERAAEAGVVKVLLLPARDAPGRARRLPPASPWSAPTIRACSIPWTADSRSGAGRSPVTGKRIREAGGDDGASGGPY